MNKNTIEIINSINQKLYSLQSKEFSDSRKNNWNGWNKISNQIRENIKILDIACGNGRFANFVTQTLNNNNFNYVGIDSSNELIEIAKQSFQEENIQFLIKDILIDELKFKEKFDLIVVFGFMHHIPSLDLRINFLKFINENLNQNARAIITTWNFDKLNLFKNRLSNEEINNLGIDINELEKNDYFLKWMNEKNIARYSHLYDTKEMENLLNIAKLKIENKFEADGNNNITNTYYIISKIDN